MAIYGTYTENGAIVRGDGVRIPADPANRDYQAAMAAVASGDTIAAYVPAPPTPDELRIRAIRLNARRQALVTAIQNNDDAQLIAYINGAVTDLASARTMIVNLALLVAGYIRN